MKRFVLSILGFFTVGLSAITDIPGIGYHARVDRDWMRPIELTGEMKQQGHFSSCIYYPENQTLSCTYDPQWAKEKDLPVGYVKQRHVLTSTTEPTGNVKIYGTFKDKQLIPMGKTKEVTYYVYRAKGSK